MQHTTQEFDKLVRVEKDIVDRLCDYVFSIPGMATISLEQQKKINKTLRGEFADEVAKKSPTEREEIINATLHLFNGRNATEIARKLQISRATVYRVLKQHGRKMPDGA